MCTGVLQEYIINGPPVPLKWQYFALEAGVSSIYPGFKVDGCTLYNANCLCGVVCPLV